MAEPVLVEEQNRSGALAGLTEPSCSRCVLDATVVGLEFDDTGVCQYCKLHDDLEQQYLLGEAAELRLRRIVAEIKEAGRGKEYDCVVGVSGGVDSTYTLYLAKQLGLRPIAAHFDNGWNSEIAVSNIKNATAALDVDLHTCVVDWEEFKGLQIAFLKASVPDAEIPTDQAIKPVLLKAAAELGIKYVVHGHSFRTEGKIPPMCSYGDSRYVRSVYARFGEGNKLSSYPMMSTSELISSLVARRKRIVRLLYHVEFQKKRAKQVISAAEFEAILARPPKTFLDYPTHFDWMRRFAKPLIVTHKLLGMSPPPILYLIKK